MLLHTKLSSFSASIRYLILFITVTLISACQSLSTGVKTNLNIEQKSQLSHWQARGKILWKSQSEKQSGYYFWHQQGDDFQFSINTFLGINVLKLSSIDKQAKLEFDGKTYHGHSARQLINQFTGYDMPVANFRHWMLAELTGQEFNVKYLANDTIDSFETYAQSNENWRVSYKDYTQIKQLLLPQQISIKNASTSLKVSVSNWELIR